MLNESDLGYEREKLLIFRKEERGDEERGDEEQRERRVFVSWMNF